jgi:predicted ArsR family transcriptional regulator
MSAKNPKENTIIRNPNQVRVMSSPMRNAIHQVVNNQGKASIREIGEQLGREPASLYRHIDLLVEAGLLTEVGSRSTARRDAKLYSAERKFFAYDPGDQEMTDALCEFTKISMRRAASNVSRSLQSGEAKTRGDNLKRDTYVGTIMGWLSPDDLAEINEHLNAIIDLYADKAKKPGTELISITLAMSPPPTSITDS